MYKTKTLQVRLTDDEFARLERIVAWMNDGDDWQEKDKRKKVIDFQGWGRVTTSDVVRFLVNGSAVDVLHARILPRSTKKTRSSRRRTTSTR